MLPFNLQPADCERFLTEESWGNADHFLSGEPF